jgi:alpha,alpha-trehalase
MDMAESWQMLGEAGRAHGWREAAGVRKETMNQLMWNSRGSFFGDYDYQRQRRNPMPSLAMFYPMWAGLATPEQAESMVETWLPQFEQPGGLVTTLKPKDGAQWAYPNGWAPLQMLITDALDAYGFRTQADRIRVKWLNTCATTLAATGKMWEKLNVVAGNHHAEGGLYGQLSGFSWTWASCDHFLHKLRQSAATKI